MSAYVVIPAYNEEDTIFEVVSKVKKYIQSVIVVDDSSTDNTNSLAKAAGAITIKTETNEGYDLALEKGFEFAALYKATSVLTFDADGQHPYEKIQYMINLVESGKYDLVIGRRDQLPRISEKIFSFVSNILYGVSDITCGMKCYRMSLYKSHGAFSKRKSIGTELALKSIRKGVKFLSVNISVSEREGISRIGIDLKSEIDFIKAVIYSCFL